MALDQPAVTAVVGALHPSNRNEMYGNTGTMQSGAIKILPFSSATSATPTAWSSDEQSTYDSVVDDEPPVMAGGARSVTLAGRAMPSVWLNAFHRDSVMSKASQVSVYDDVESTVSTYDDIEPARPKKNGRSGQAPNNVRQDRATMRAEDSPGHEQNAPPIRPPKFTDSSRSRPTLVSISQPESASDIYENL